MAVLCLRGQRPFLMVIPAQYAFRRFSQCERPAVVGAVSHSRVAASVFGTSFAFLGVGKRAIGARISRGNRWHSIQARRFPRHLRRLGCAPRRQAGVLCSKERSPPAAFYSARAHPSRRRDGISGSGSSVEISATYPRCFAPTFRAESSPATFLTRWPK